MPKLMPVLGEIRGKGAGQLPVGIAMTIAYRTAEASVASRVDHWQQVVAETLLPLAGRHDGGDFEAELLAGQVGAVKVAEVTTPGGECFRTPRLIRRSDRGLYQVDVLATGRVMIEHGGRRARLNPGDIAFIDPAQPVRYRTSAAKHVTILFPRPMLPLRSTDAARLLGVRVPGDRGTGALISSLALQLPRHLDDWPTTEATRLGASLIDMLSVALAARLNDLDLVPGTRQDDLLQQIRRDDLLRRIYAFIEAHLGEPDLSPATIAAAHHISLRYLHKLFQSERATVAGWVRQRRLERSRQDLLSFAERDQTVSAIGAKWGMPNAAHFSSAFKAAYGMSPVEYRVAAQPPRQGAA